MNKILDRSNIKNKTRTLRVASGMTCHMMAGARDADNGNRLVYLSFMGSTQSVKSTWAALKGGGNKPNIYALGGKVHLRRQEHAVIQKILPCGWKHMIMINKQASVIELDPSEPFYILGFDRSKPRQEMPAMFFPMLSAAMPFPILEDWAPYIWEQVRHKHFVYSLWDTFEIYCHRIRPNQEAFSGIIKHGFDIGKLSF
jgi:hypothetical protein